MQASKLLLRHFRSCRHLINKKWYNAQPRILSSLFTTSNSKWNSPTQKLIDKTSNLLQNILNINDNETNKLLNESQYERINKSIKDLEYPFFIGFVGEWNKGKSTIINTIIGEPIAEVDDIPATTTPTLYIHKNRALSFLI